MCFFIHMHWCICPNKSSYCTFLFAYVCVHVCAHPQVPAARTSVLILPPWKVLLCLWTEHIDPICGLAALSFSPLSLFLLAWAYCERRARSVWTKRLTHHWAALTTFPISSLWLKASGVSVDADVCTICVSVEGLLTRRSNKSSCLSTASSSSLHSTHPSAPTFSLFLYCPLHLSFSPCNSSFKAWGGSVGGIACFLIHHCLQAEQRANNYSVDAWHYPKDCALFPELDACVSQVFLAV